MDCITLGQIAGEPFLGINANASLATAVRKLRDCDCAAVVYRIKEKWAILPAGLLPQLLLLRPETLEAPVSALGEPLTTLSYLDSPATLRSTLQAEAWVGVEREGKLVKLLQWASLGLSRLVRQTPVSAQRVPSTDAAGRVPAERRKVRPKPSLRSTLARTTPGCLSG